MWFPRYSSRVQPVFKCQSKICEHPSSSWQIAWDRNELADDSLWGIRRFNSNTNWLLPNVHKTVGLFLNWQYSRYQWLTTFFEHFKWYLYFNIVIKHLFLFGDNLELRENMFLPNILHVLSKWDSSHFLQQ